MYEDDGGTWRVGLVALGAPERCMGRAGDGLLV